MGIEKVAVLGAGLMGRGIAHVAALGGYQVALQDVSDDILAQALKVIEGNLKKGIELGKVTKETVEAALGRIKPVTGLKEAVENADFVIEAVPEDLQLKHQIFMDLDTFCPPHTVMATNTSAKSITEIAAVSKRPHMVVGMHFFNPAHVMKLVEIVRGLETCDEAVRLTEEVAHRMGKETVEVNEFPGFATSRINAMIGNEAFYMLMEGVASARDIDKALKLGLNHPMGPFELGDLVGWDTRLKVLEYLHATLGAKFRPCPLLIKYVKAGRLGRKVGRGVYEYPDKK
ncbi:3-hydroxybutyryl-CoA dehydrogenase [Clostridiales bacterium PH28_bin88]|nr:3-hydroxybutyryl-CoA dehydrogenase [Clostridiales bacterium PH28_bin88]